ncbi:MAG: DUF5009 domain-containing protein, partial [bacterium]
LTYLLSGLLMNILSAIPAGEMAGKAIELKRYIYYHIFASWLSSPNASLLFSISYVLLCVLLITPLYRKRIFVKI